MSALTASVAITGILAAGIIYGNDAFCALVQRPALAALDDATLTAVMGRIHQYGDRRLPAPGIIGVLAAAVATIRGSVPDAIAAGVALVCMLAWLRLYLHVAAPINRALTAAAMAHETPDNARQLQTRWDSIITPRALLMGVAVAASPSAPPDNPRTGAIASLVGRQPPGHGRRGRHEFVRQRARVRAPSTPYILDDLGTLSGGRQPLRRSQNVVPQPAFGGSRVPGYRATSERFIGARCRGVVRSSVLATGADLVPTVTPEPEAVLPVKRCSGQRSGSASATMMPAGPRR